MPQSFNFRGNEVFHIILKQGVIAVEENRHAFVLFFYPRKLNHGISDIRGNFMEQNAIGLGQRNKTKFPLLGTDGIPALFLVVIICCLVNLLPATLSATAATSPGGKDRMTNLVAGVLLHDQGILSDHHEDGLDLNLEVEFARLGGTFWHKMGSPRPHIGTTLNYNGDTSIIYGGLTYEFDMSRNLFFNLLFGLAMHNGPLHKDEQGCKADSDCGFGSRMLFHFGLEAGVKLPRKQAISLFLDHVSQGYLLAEENEGIDHFGIRYRFGF